MKARVLRLHEFKGIDGIHLDEVEIGEPGPNEVRIAVEAFSLNYGDFELFEDKYMFSLDLPARFGDECSGIIDAVGENVDNFKIGDAVSTLPWMNEGYGVDGEFAIVPADFVAHYPSNLSPSEACCIWVAYLTAYYALVEIASVHADDWVLITAGSSSAGLAAMETCRMFGAKTIATSRTSQNQEFLLQAGFDHVIAQDAGQLAAQILKYSQNEGTRIIYDPIGGKIVQDYAPALAQNAIIFLYGGMDPSPTILPEIEMTQKAACLRPFSVFNHIDEKPSRDRGVRFVYEALEKGDLLSHVEKVYPLEEFREAFEDQKKSVARRGKMVISTKS